MCWCVLSWLLGAGHVICFSNQTTSLTSEPIGQLAKHVLPLRLVLHPNVWHSCSGAPYHCGSTNQVKFIWALYPILKGQHILMTSAWCICTSLRCPQLILLSAVDNKDYSRDSDLEIPYGKIDTSWTPNPLDSDAWFSPLPYLHDRLSPWYSR